MALKIRNFEPTIPFNAHDPLKYQFYFAQENFLDKHFWLFKSTISLPEANRIADESAQPGLVVDISDSCRPWRMYYVPELRTIFVSEFAECLHLFGLLHEIAHDISGETHTRKMARVFCLLVAKYIGKEVASDLRKYLNEVFRKNSAYKNVTPGEVRDVASKRLVSLCGGCTGRINGQLYAFITTAHLTSIYPNAYSNL